MAGSDVSTSKSNCVSERAQKLGYFWQGPYLFSPDGVKIARYARKLCSSDGTWGSERYNPRASEDALLTGGDPMIVAEFSLDEVKRQTEEWLIDHPNPPL